MKHSKPLTSKPLLLASSISLILFMASPLANAGLVVKPAVQAELAALKKQPKQRLKIAEPTYYIVELEDAPLAVYSGGVPGLAATRVAEPTRERLNVHSIAAREYGAFLNSRQQSFAQSMQRRLPNAQIARQYTTALNAVAVSTYDRNAMAALRALPGVKRVYKNEMRYAQMDVSVDAIVAEPVWQLAGGRERAGEGIRIAIIDSGIRPENPMFSGQGMAAPTSRPNDDYCATTDMSFCNNKVIVARYSEPTFTINANEHLSPLDYGGHGTHVAGTAAGALTTAAYQGSDLDISGVAPGAYLMVYKALFSTPTDPGSGSDVMLLNALENAVLDGADVINNSWGGGPGDDGADSVYNSVFGNIENAGILVVTAAGNDGPGAQTIGCPGCVEPGIIVAAGDMGRFFLNEISYGNQSWQAFPGAGDFTITSDITAKLVLAADVNETNGLGCSAFTANSLTDAIVLVDRGECSFSDKATNAQNAGAKGLIVANNEPGIINMSMDGVTLPSVSISEDAGADLRSSYVANIEVTIAAAVAKIDAEAQNRMASFSSRGPNGNSTFLKPEITAPGSSILSATSPDQSGSQFALNSGTSMATPQVSGAAAVIRQLRPELDALQLKSILMGTAQTERMRAHNSDEFATAFAQGAGLLNMAAAEQATFALDKPSAVLNGCLGLCEFTRTVENLTNQPITLFVAGDVGQTLINMSFTTSAQTAAESFLELTLPAAGKATFTVHIDSSFAKEGYNYPTLRIADGSRSVQEYPVVLTNERTDDARVLYSEVTSGEPSWGEKVTVATLFSGSTAGAENRLRVNFPEDFAVANVSVNETNATGTLTVEDTYATWQGTFTAASDSSRITAVTAPGGSLLELPESMLLSDIQSLGCAEEVCDEVAVPIEGLSQLGGLQYNGDVYDMITVWENGLMAAGDQTAVAATYYNLAMPDAERPNNLISPLWTDFTMGGELGGEIYFAPVKYEGDVYVVIEWNDAKPWRSTPSESDAGYTFSVWLRLGENVPPKILFNYTDIPSMPTFATIGLEDIYGMNGIQHYFDGEGSAVASGEALAAELAINASRVVLNYEVPLDEGKNFAVTTPWNTAVAVDVFSELAVNVKQGVGSALANTGNDTFEALTPIRVQPTGARKIELTSTSSKGKLELVGDESIRFTPNVKFSGTEVVRYRIVDAAGNKTQTYTVSFTVEAKPGSKKKWYEGSLGVFFAFVAMLIGFRRFGLARTA